MSVFRLARPCRIAASIVLCSVGLIGCSKKVEEKAEAAKSQIVARLGEDVVTTQELDNELRIAQVPTDKRKDPAVVKQVLGELVSRKYLVRQALDAKLDREPTVLLDLLRARETVLAKAAASRDVAKKSSAIVGSDVELYINNNPMKFANRQVARIEQIVVPTNAASQEVFDAAREMKSLDEVVQKLTALGIAHSRSTGTLSSADIPADVFDRIRTQQADDVFLLRGQPNSLFFKVNSVETRPLEGEAAARQARQAMQLDLARSEASLASIEAVLAAKYEGEYAEIMKMQAPQ
ncbi:hypothetical protein ACQR1Y_32585 [Bradyrhizobium sp. HKCCYLRH3099]|uniref:hypothetical protein n=1 Tax=unclassified Bradyrhizobium TaxID=2631580 RepID=UPI003EB8FD34